MKHARILMLAAALPFAGLAQQLQLDQVTSLPSGGTTETPINGTLDVGKATIGQALQTRLRIHNTGQDVAEIDTILTDVGPFSLSNVPLMPFVIAGGGFRDVYLQFAPTAAQDFTSTLTINASNKVALIGHGIQGPKLVSGSKEYQTGDEIYVGKTQVGTAVQLTLTISDPVQTPMDITLAVSGNDFGGPGGADAAFTLAPGSSRTFQVSFTPSIAWKETGTLTINSMNYVLAGDGFEPLLPDASIVLSSNAVTSASQVQASVHFAAKSTASATGLLQLAFQPATGLADDPAIQFLSNGKRTINLSVNPGDDTANFDGASSCAFQTGTTAGTITLTLTIDGATTTTSVTIAPAQTSLDSMTAVRTASDILVRLEGFDNTHATSSLAFTFFDASGKTIAPGLVQVNVASAFVKYFATYPQAGGTFMLQADFPVSGTITLVSAVEIQVTNPQATLKTARLPVQ